MFTWKLILVQSQKIRNIYVANEIYQFVSEVNFATTYYVIAIVVHIKTFLIKLVQIRKQEIERNRSRNYHVTQ